MCNLGALRSRSKDGSKFGYTTLHDGDKDIDLAAVVVAKGTAALVDTEGEGENNSRDGTDTNSLSNNLSDHGRYRDRDRDVGGEGAGGGGGPERGEDNTAGGDGDAADPSRDSESSDGTAIDDDSIMEEDGYAPVSTSTTLCSDCRLQKFARFITTRETTCRADAVVRRFSFLEGARTQTASHLLLFDEQNNSRPAEKEQSVTHTSVRARRHASQQLYMHTRGIPVCLAWTYVQNS